MNTKDFTLFSALMRKAHEKAFAEPLGRLPHGKAQLLSWLIYDATGILISYKTLGNYAQAIAHKAPASINPTASTLSVLVQFVEGGKKQEKGPAGAVWYRFKQSTVDC